MNLPPDALKTFLQLNAGLNPLEDILGSAAAKALAEYAKPLAATQRVLEENEYARKLLGESTRAIRESFGAAAQFNNTEEIRAALGIGHSAFFNEFAAIRNAIGSTFGFEASMLTREAIQVDSTYVNELQKLQKALHRESSSTSALAALKAGTNDSLAQRFVSNAPDFQGTAILKAAQSLQNLYSSPIAALQLEAQRPHVLLDAYQRATSWLDPLKDLKQLTSFSEIEKYRALKSAADPLQLYRDSLQAVAKNPFGNLASDSISRVFESLSRFEEEFGASSWDDDDVEVAPNDIATYNDFARAQLNEVALSPASIEALVTTFLVAYQALPSVRDKKIFATYIYPVLVSLLFACINPYSDFKIKQQLEATNQTSQKAVQQTARNSGAPRHILDSFRFVTAQSLSIHMNGRIKSPTIGTLRFGQPVEIMKKDGDWTLIHYGDLENEIEIQGWVLSRYLKRFK